MSTPSAQEIREVGISIARTAKNREISFLAASFAYYAFVSLIPMVILALALGSLIGGQQLAERLVVLAGDFLPQAGEDILIEALMTETGRTQATVVALLVSTWGALKVVRGLSLAFDRVYGAAGKDSLPTQIRDGITVLLAGVLALLLMIVLGIAIGLLAEHVPFGRLLSWLGLLFGLVLVFIPIYYVLPPIDVTPVEILPGVMFTATGWVVLQFGFQVYAANAGQYQAYGVLGAIILFVTWLYFAGILLLLGAVINVVLSRPDLADG
ncbi:YihY/virulence factor BrkB family protein [Halobacteria archaeon AArc-curdl1]|uniref:YihY/virulence factor BrkB family protein n=1 Tax=Natronosalvus hydrolyticus TaxID=2979988 RepID=A0AAP2Z698_9EURY|nr:YihY/virulence factor BrkB family protein [Halobacteria archaeon AArc-curdl1]